MIIGTIIVSFLLESIVSNQIPLNTNFFSPCFVLMACIIIYPYFKKNDYKYLLTCGFIGLTYDISFTSTLLFYTVIFVIMGYIIKSVNYLFANHIISTLVNSIISILIYRVLSYVILVLVGYFEFSFSYLLKGIYSSFILNIIYITILYFITEIISQKYHISKDK